MGGQKLKQWIGSKVGRLTVIKIAGRVKTRLNLLCKCDCGKEVEVLDSNIGRHTNSCGCLKIKKSKGEIGLKRVYDTYKIHAKEYGRNFDLTVEQIKKLTSSNCFYCEATPTAISSPYSEKRNNKETVEYSKYYYNGIDRIDSEKGYALDNVVPCCYSCNRAKSDLTTEQFRQLIKAIYLNWCLPKKNTNDLDRHTNNA
jgi:hypothetical protein